MWDFVGGETRLIAVPRVECFKELVAAIAQSIALDSYEVCVWGGFGAPGFPQSIYYYALDDELQHNETGDLVGLSQLTRDQIRMPFHGAYRIVPCSYVVRCNSRPRPGPVA